MERLRDASVRLKEEHEHKLDLEKYRLCFGFSFNRSFVHASCHRVLMWLLFGNVVVYPTCRIFLHRISAAQTVAVTYLTNSWLS